MALKDRLNQLEKELPNQRRAEFEAKCRELADRFRKGAVSYVENAIKNGSYTTTTTGFFRNKKTIKRVSGETYAIIVHDESSHMDVSPQYCYSDGDYWYSVRSVEEREFFRAEIKKALESEGFKVWYGVSQYYGLSTGPSVHYSIEWE